MRSYTGLLLLALTLGCRSEDDQATDDTDTDVGPTCAYEIPDRPAPGDLEAGVARLRIPAPVGIGTVGFGPETGISSPSPFASVYPGTTGIWGHPDVRVVVLSRGEGNEVVFVRLDSVGVFAQLRNEIVQEISTRLGRDMDHAILMGGTHTHSGPGGVLNTGQDGTTLYDIIADSFFPAFYERFVDAVADAVELAYEDLEPARVGFAEAWCPDGHSDRRCDDGMDYQNGTLPVVAVERDGQVDALVGSYAVHGTLFGRDHLLLSQDVSGAIEEALEDRWDHPVMAVLFNAWAADMGPGNPEGAPRTGLALDGKYTQGQAVGWSVADAVDDVLEDMRWDDQPELNLQIHRVPIGREEIGYDDETFENYPYGAVYCDRGGDCDTVERLEGLDDACIPFPEATPAPSQTDVTVGRIGDFAVVTFPGEPGTLLAEHIMGRITEAHPDVKDFLFLGYTQDYLGYSILEDDWWLGGYEASGALWGPKQGQYLSDNIVRLYDVFLSGECPGEEPDALVPFPWSIDDPYTAATAVQPNTVEADVDASYAPSGVVTLTVRGQDPWLGAPLAHLLDGDGDPVTRSGGIPVDSDSRAFDVRLAVTPAWDEDAPSGRTFSWTFRLPVTPAVEGAGPGQLAAGDYRIEVDVPQPGGGVETVQSAVFRVVPPT